MLVADFHPLVLPLLLLVLSLALIETKHLLVDWVWQPCYEHQNKGIYGHWGGIRHSLKNALGTVACLFLVYPWSPTGTWITVFLIDFITHYHIDWSKKQVTKRYGLDPMLHPQFWWLTGFDQYLHHIVYLVLALGVAVVNLPK